MSRFEDVKQLKTYEEIYDSLRLDYDGSKFKPDSDESICVIRYNVENCSQIKPPYKPELGGTVAGGPPFTGNGFTGALNGQIIPEYVNKADLEIKDGAKLIVLDREGKEIASYTKNGPAFNKD